MTIIYYAYTYLIIRLDWKLKPVGLPFVNNVQYCLNLSQLKNKRNRYNIIVMEEQIYSS